MPLDPLSDVRYEALAVELLDGVEAQIDRWLQADVIDIDIRRSGGMLELTFPAGSKIIVNTQPPLQEIWLAARRGGFHFNNRNGRWVDTKGSGQPFHDVLSLCASEQAGEPLRFETGPSSPSV